MEATYAIFQVNLEKCIIFAPFCSTFHHLYYILLYFCLFCKCFCKKNLKNLQSNGNIQDVVLQIFFSTIFSYKWRFYATFEPLKWGRNQKKLLFYFNCETKTKKFYQGLDKFVDV